MVPKLFKETDWDDIRVRVKSGEAWNAIADDYGVKESSLRAAAYRRDIRSPKNIKKKRGVLPVRTGIDNPQLRKMISQVARETGEDNPEKLIVAVRDELIDIIDALKANMMEDAKWEGMPELGVYSRPTPEIGQYAIQATKYDLGMHEMIALLKDISKLEVDDDNLQLLLNAIQFVLCRIYGARRFKRSFTG